MEYGRYPDDDLVSRFREGDVSAYEAILDRYSQPIYNFTLRVLGERADAEDAAQQTFIQAYSSLPSAKAEMQLRPWLYQVARNKCIDMLRRRRTVPLSSLEREDHDLGDIEPVDGRPLPPEIYEQAELQDLLQEAIADLPLRAREVVVMRYVNDLTFAEIGTALGLPENTAKTLFQRAKLRLRAFLSSRM